MKIGIVTFHRGRNCGAVLQCLAMKTVLERLGFEVKIVDCNTVGEGDLLPRHGTLRIWLGWVHAILRTFAEAQRFWFRYCIFMHRFMPLTSRIKIGERFPEDIDYFILGSDQVLNPNLTHRYLETFLMRNRCDDAKKIAYAASFGISQLPEKWIPLYRECLSKFKALGIREGSGVGICRDQLGLDKAVLTVDPTLLLDAADYRVYEKKVPAPGEYVLVYWIGAAKEYVVGLAHRIAAMYGMKVVVASITTSHETDEWRPVDPGEFLYLFRNARFVVATSFHATAFSIIEHKPFITVKPNGMAVADRLIGLLTQLGLQNHLVNEDEPLDDVRIREIFNVDFDQVDNSLKVLRRTSIGFLRSALNVGD